MKTKLTLTVEKELIQQAKEIAQSRGTSISSLVEQYIGNLTRRNRLSFSEKWRGSFKQAPQTQRTALGNRPANTVAPVLHR